MIPITLTIDQVTDLKRGKLSVVRKPIRSDVDACRFGHPGSILWVKEDFYRKGEQILYAADNPRISGFTMVPATHMPFDQSRYLIRVNNIIADNGFWKIDFTFLPMSWKLNLEGKKFVITPFEVGEETQMRVEGEGQSFVMRIEDLDFKIQNPDQVDDWVIELEGDISAAIYQHDM